MIGLLTGMMMILVTWLIGLLVFSGVGLLVLRLMREEGRYLYAFWIGLAFTVLFLQIWHLFLPVTALAAVLVGIVGFAGFVLRAREVAAWTARNVKACLLGGAMLFAFAAWLSNRAMGPLDPEWAYDAGLYHWSAIRWANEYAIVPGLGNLSGRLAFNSSFHLYEALLNVGTWAGRCHHVTTGLMLLAGMTLPVASAVKVLTGSVRFAVRDVFRLLMVPPLLRVALEHVPNIVLTLPVFVVGFVLADALLSLVFVSATDENRLFGSRIILLLAALGVTFKLSLVVFGGLCAAIAAFQLVKQSGTVRNIASWALVLALLVSTWVVRGYILSGYPAFPSALASLPVEWRVPVDLVNEEANWIRSWARMPKVHYSVVLADWNWLGEWAYGMWYNKLMVVTPLSLAAAAGVALALRRGCTGESRRLLLFLLPLVGALAFWFFSAPSPRFAGALFWILGSGLTAIAVMRWDLPARKHGMKVLLAASLVLTVGVHAAWDKFVSPGPRAGWYPVPVAETKIVTTDSGLELIAPAEGDQCWNAPLPCTPYPKPGLMLRKKGDFGSGFLLKR